MLHGYETGRIVRLPRGEYVEVHEPVDVYERWRLVDYESHQPRLLRPDEKGRIRLRNRARAVLSRWFFQDRIAPITAAELRDADDDHRMAIERSASTVDERRP
ncbi:MAG TPA: hypothetical protein PKE40_15695 [Arachnia sp.]|nr:hypothetical protein [Arachnia sp.]HMT87784.1 hypothetical protein [Arachnia sp.]